LLAVLPPDIFVAPQQDAPVSQQHVSALVLDATTGDEVWAGTIALPNSMGGVLTANGFIGNPTQPENAANLAVIAGIGLDGRSTWRYTVRAGNAIALIGAGIIEYSATSGGDGQSTITLLR
jgi:hypothetical protein